jgi:FlaA1/EpsC-like NDP-sugar epimerase
VIHALLLTAGLLSARAIVRTVHRDLAPNLKFIAPVEHIIFIGSNKLSALYIDLLRAYAPDRKRVIAVLDDCAEMAGRSIAGFVCSDHYRLTSIVNEFEHGIRTDRIIVRAISIF